METVAKRVVKNKDRGSECELFFFSPTFSIFHPFPSLPFPLPFLSLSFPAKPIAPVPFFLRPNGKGELRGYFLYSFLFSFFSFFLFSSSLLSFLVALFQRHEKNTTFWICCETPEEARNEMVFPLSSFFLFFFLSSNQIKQKQALDKDPELFIEDPPSDYSDGEVIIFLFSFFSFLFFSFLFFPFLLYSFYF